MEPDEVHMPTPDGPIETVGVRYKRDANGEAHDINPDWGRQIAAAAARIVQGDADDLPLAEQAWAAVQARHREANGA